MVAVLQPLKQGKIIAIDRAVVLVGRSSDCDNVINGSQKISRRHCCLVQVDNDYYVRDLGSMNGVWLNGDRVNRDAKMSAGDRLSIGDVEFLFHPNARIEQKKTVASPPDAEAAGAAEASQQAQAPDKAATAGDALPDHPAKQPSNVAAENDVPPLGDPISDHDIDAPLDDVIPLEDLEREEEEQFETNEYEVIDEPIGEDDDDLLRDDIVVFDDD